MNQSQTSATIILIGVSIVPLLMAIDFVRGQASPESSTAAPEFYESIPSDPRLLALDRRALDEAYHEQIKKLFGVWVASGAPAEATQLKNGLRIARRAYGQASQQIVKREQEPGDQK